MSKAVDGLLKLMRLKDDEYDNSFEEFEDAEKQEPVKSVKKERKKVTAKKEKPRKIYDDIDNDISDDYLDDDVEDEGFGRRILSRPRRNNKITPLRGSRSMEVRVLRPVDFESCQEISDIIIANKAAIINFESVSSEEAQRIIDFVSGSCYAVDGTVKQVSENIVIVTPNNIEITGDFEEAISSAVTVPEFFIE